jgi:hypothetical protein
MGTARGQLLGRDFSGNATYQELAACTDDEHVLCHWGQCLFVAEGYEGVDAGCAASRDVARYQRDEEEQ